MDIERWADICDIYNNPDFEGYQVSDWGNVRGFWHVPRHGRGARKELDYDLPPRIVPQSLDSSGYWKIGITVNNKKYSPKVHVMVARAFVYNPDPIHLDTVDHIQSGPEGKLNNHYTNLRWMSRGDNIRKAWADGVCEERRRRQCKPVWVIDLWERWEMRFPSLKSACRHLCLKEDTVRHAMSRGDGECEIKGPHTMFRLEYIEGEDRLMTSHEDDGLEYLVGYDGCWC